MKNESSCSKINTDTISFSSFTNLGVECVRRRDVEESLRQRERRGKDPFGTGFGNLNGMTYNRLRLCFQVFIPGNRNPYFPLQPVVSRPIRDRKAAMSNLKIMKLSHFSAPACGGKEVILLCERISRNDVEVWFFEIKDGRVVWEAKADFTPADVHRQVAIAFRTPRYYMDILEPVQVYIQLGTSAEDQERGEPLPFMFYPRRRETMPRKRKRFMEVMELYSQYLRDLGDSNTVADETSHKFASSVPVPRPQRQKNTEYGAGKNSDHFSSSVKVPRTRRSQNMEYEGLSGAACTSQSLGGSFFAGAMALAITSESGSSTFYENRSRSNTFEYPSEASNQSIDKGTSEEFSSVPVPRPQRQKNTEYEAGSKAGYLSSPVNVHRTGRPQNTEYGGLPGAACSSQSLGSSFIAKAMAPAITSESSSSTFYETISPPTTFEYPSEASSQSIGPSSDVSNSYPVFSPFETLLQSTAFAGSSEASGQSQSLYFGENNSLPQHSTSLAETWTTNLNSLTESSTSLLQTPRPSTVDVGSFDTFPSILTSLIHEQQHEIPVLNSEPSSGEDDLSSLLLDSFSSINLHYDLSNNLNINQNMSVDSHGN